MLPPLAPGTNERPLIRDAVVVGALALALLLPGIGRAYWDRDEAEYAAIARAMLRSGDWAVPRLFGELASEKPPLAMALSALSFRLCGESEIAGRAPHVLLAAGSAVLLLVLGRRLFGARTGFRAALLYSTSLLFVLAGRLLLTDSSLVFFVLASLAGLAAALGGRSWGAAALGGGALGLALLAKGPIAWLPTVAFAAGYGAAGPGAARSDRRRRLAALVATQLLASVCASLPWLVLAARQTGGELVRRMLWEENVGRFLRPMEGHRGPAVYYLAALAVALFPWTGLLAGLRRRRPAQRDPWLWATFAWAAGVLGFFSLSATKLPHYLLPALPALALLLAKSADELASRSGLRRAFAWTTAGTGVLLLAAGAWALRALDLPELAAPALPLLALVALLALLVPLVPWRGGVILAAACPAALALGLPPILDPARCLPRLGVEARHHRLPQEPIGELGLHEPALAYYAEAERVERWKTAADLRRTLAQSPTGTVLVWLESRSVAELRRAHLRAAVLLSGASLIDSARGTLELVRVTPARRSPQRGSPPTAD